ncbi:MAG: hypothetical protein WBA84_08720 [Carnobacterium sp.]|uniref:hypothetical protein n=1 Tax=Carnobacterium sp. TaxID=48221 RepID=UPI003C72D385
MEKKRLKDNYFIKEYLKERFENIEKSLLTYHDDFKGLRNSLEQKDLISDSNVFSFFYTDEKATIILLNDLYKEKNGYNLKEYIRENIIVNENLEKKPFILSDNLFDTKYLEKNKKKSNTGLSSNFVFDKNHPEAYYATTRNISEMKLKMIEDGIFFTYKDADNSITREIYNVLKKTNAEIESYFSSIIHRRGLVKKDNTGAIIRTNSEIVHKQLHYREISLFDSNWYKASNWMNFFIQLGTFIELLESDINIFISYIDRTVPATLVAMGIMDIYFEKIKEDKVNIQELGNYYNVGDEIFFLDGSDWRRAIVKGTLNFNPDFDPYLEITVTRDKSQGKTTELIPYSLWSKKIRSGGKVKGFSGSSTKVTLNDRISEVIELKYSKEVINYLQLKPELHINIVGRGVDSKLRQFRESVQFSNQSGSFLITDYLYLDNDEDTNYINVHMISSDNKAAVTPNSISLFIGAKAVLDFHESKTKKNIFFTSRIRDAHTSDNELLISQEREKTRLSKEEQLLMIEEIKDFMKKDDISIPNGVELYVF